MYGAVIVILRNVGVLKKPQVAGSVTVGLAVVTGSLNTDTGTRSHNPRSNNAASEFFGMRVLRGSPSARKLKSVNSDFCGSRDATSTLWQCAQLPFCGWINRLKPRCSCAVNFACPRIT